MVKLKIFGGLASVLSSLGPIPIWAAKIGICALGIILLIWAGYSMKPVNSAANLSAVAAGATLFLVEIDNHLVTDGMGLAGEDKAGLQFARFQPMGNVHVDLPFYQLRLAG